MKNIYIFALSCLLLNFSDNAYCGTVDILIKTIKNLKKNQQEELNRSATNAFSNSELFNGSKADEISFHTTDTPAENIAEMSEEEREIFEIERKYQLTREQEKDRSASKCFDNLIEYMSYQ